MDCSLRYRPAKPAGATLTFCSFLASEQLALALLVFPTPKGLNILPANKPQPILYKFSHIHFHWLCQVFPFCFTYF